MSYHRRLRPAVDGRTLPGVTEESFALEVQALVGDEVSDRGVRVLARLGQFVR